MLGCGVVGRVGTQIYTIYMCEYRIEKYPYMHSSI
nr:MAG TPA: hypothetical protein [Caudoviricetes sp.]